MCQYSPVAEPSGHGQKKKKRRKKEQRGEYGEL
jgi:hypothetical protein